MTATQDHIPVLLPEILTALNIQAGQTIVDGTFGRGGYTQAFLNAGALVTAFDLDETAQAVAPPHENLTFILDNFCTMADHLPAASQDAVVLDLGVSSPQLDEAARGFSFQADGTLDMRMGQSGQTAADVVNTLSETDLANIIYRYGDEKASRRIAKAIVSARTETSITRTLQLARIIHNGIGFNKDRNGKDTATRTFQALRIHVNKELESLELALPAATTILKQGGILAIVTFHSLEDRIVKRFLKPLTNNSRHLPIEIDQNSPLYKLVKSKPITASNAECAKNPRARSAKLRIGIKL